jgi:hypothetical protein
MQTPLSSLSYSPDDTDEDDGYARPDSPAALIFSDDAGRCGWLADIAAGRGARVVATLPVASAAARMDIQVSGLVILDIAADDGAMLDRLLDRIEDGAAMRTGALVIAPPGLVDVVARVLEVTGTDVLIDPDEAEVAAALDRLVAPRIARLEDSAGDANGVRLRQLSDEIGRIARTLAGLSASSEAASAPPTEPRGTAARLQVARTEIRLRRLREQYFDRALFADPAWDMLLDLAAAEIERRRVAVSSLCIAAAVPATTALRWIAQMSEHGLLERYPDPDDGRRVFIALTRPASDGMMRYLDACGAIRAS